MVVAVPVETSAEEDELGAERFKAREEVGETALAIRSARFRRERRGALLPFGEARLSPRRGAVKDVRGSESNCEHDSRKM